MSFTSKVRFTHLLDVCGVTGRYVMTRGSCGEQDV